MVYIRVFTASDIPSVRNIIFGYVSHEKYTLAWNETPETTSFTLHLTPLPVPYVKHFDLEPADYYTDIITNGFSLAACSEERVIAIALGTIQSWNHSFWLQEFHVMRDFQGQGIGQQLMDAVKGLARANDCRIIICETQNTNVPAIRFYRRMGFKVEALDLSLYTNSDYPDQEIALFMKYRLHEHLS